MRYFLAVVFVILLAGSSFASTGAAIDKCTAAKNDVYTAVKGYYQFQKDVVEAAEEAIAYGYDDIRVIRMKADWMEKAKQVEGSLTEAYEKAVEVCE